MKLLLIVLVPIVVFLLLRLGVGFASRTPQFPPLAAAISANASGNAALSELLPCPGVKPNCHFVTLELNEPGTEAIQKIRRALSSMSETTILQDEQDYLYATAKTPVMGYIDDVECKLENNGKTLNCRSASRLGHSDLGKNKKRLEEMLKLGGLA